MTAVIEIGDIVLGNYRVRAWYRSEGGEVLASDSERVTLEAAKDLAARCNRVDSDFLGAKVFAANGPDPATPNDFIGFRLVTKPRFDPDKSDARRLMIDQSLARRAEAVITILELGGAAIFPPSDGEGWYQCPHCGSRVYVSHLNAEPMRARTPPGRDLRRQVDGDAWIQAFDVFECIPCGAAITRSEAAYGELEDNEAGLTYWTDPFNARAKPRRAP